MPQIVSIKINIDRLGNVHFAFNQCEEDPLKVVYPCKLLVDSTLQRGLGADSFNLLY